MVSPRGILNEKISEFPLGRERMVLFSKLLLQASAQGQLSWREGLCTVLAKTLALATSS